MAFTIVAPSWVLSPEQVNAPTSARSAATLIVTEHWSTPAANANEPAGVSAVISRAHSVEVGSVPVNDDPAA